MLLKNNKISKEKVKEYVLESNNFKELYKKLNIVCSNNVLSKKKLEKILKEFNLIEFTFNKLGKLTTKKIIEQFKEIHEDTYDYSLVEFKNSKAKIKIICKKHGIFEQGHIEHRKGQGCSKCFHERKTIKKDDLIKDFIKIHGNKYDYSLVNYTRIDEKIKIICKKHGIFKQEPGNHKRGYGCTKCNCRKYEQNNIIKEFRTIHGDKYDYSLVEYKGLVNTNVKIICKKHGIFEQKVSNHKAGANCPFCFGKIKNKEEIINKFKKVHGDKYDYSLINFISVNHKVNIICKEHGIFNQTTRFHIRGQGCPKCASFGYKVNYPGILYYLKIEKEGEIAYKIGITNRSVQERFNGEMKYISIIKEWYYVNGQECLDNETLILSTFKYAQWKKQNLLKTGNTEMFDRDILLLDN